MAGDNETVWDRWQDVDRLFAEALELQGEARERLLAARGEADPDLVAAVRSLLASSEAAEGALTGLRRAAWEALGHEGESGGPDALKPGQRVGRWRLIEELGRGGMATVYHAERADGAYRQEVALKVLRRGLDTEEVVHRFLAERQILSGLTHPNIARLLDGGATDDGRPWLAMERVRGERIDAWADRRGLGRRERLELFLQVTDAVQFAHRHLVVHRDLKPSNVLVDSEGSVRLLDFGIAKLLDPAAGDERHLTRTFLPLTPEYASPEQLLGEPVTTASDVFQLGQLLYELLTGERPLPGDTLTETAREGWNVRDRAGRRIPGDLGLILLKALRREPERRYASAEQLARDIRRYLEGHPVTARPDSVGYRVRRFVGRHPAGVAAGAVGTLLVAAFGVVSSVQARRLAAESARVRLEAAKAAQVRDFLTGLFEVSDPNRAQGETITARELLDSGAARVRRELTDQPEVQAEMLATMGRVYTRLGLFDRARPLLRDALALHRSTPGPSVSAEIRVLRELAGGLWREDHDEAVELYEEALALAEAEHGVDSPEVAGILLDMAPRVAEQRGRQTAMLERAVGILRDAPGDNRERLADALASRANALGGTADAVELHREALTLRRELHGPVHTQVAASLNDLALTLEPTDPVAADSLMAEALEIDRGLLGPDHTTTLSIMNSLAGLRRDRGDLAGAEPLYREVLERRRKAYPGSWQEAFPLHGLGWVLTELGRPDEAEPLLRESLALLERELPPDYPLIDIARSTLGRCLAVQSRFAEAEPLLVDALERVGDPAVIGPVAANTLRQRVVELYEAWRRPLDANAYR